MNVLVNGIGNIGTTLLYILVRYKEDLGIDNIYAFKNKPMPWHKDELNDLESIGVQVYSKNIDGLKDISTIENNINYIFDCTNNGGGIKNKTWYNSLTGLIGASAQGSEKLFGKSFMSGINNSQLLKEKYAHIVSCNTHSLASILTTLSDFTLTDIDHADFVIVRRSEDLGNHERLVSANVVARHLDPNLGTHHSIDVNDLLATINQSVDLTSSDVTTPSQLMHGVRFNVKFKNEVQRKEIEKRIQMNPLVATSTKFDSNVIFERGRRNGFQGRIYSHAIIISNNLLLKGNNIMGWAFIPQEGNTLISSLHAFGLQTSRKKIDAVIKKITNDLTQKQW